MQNNQRYHLFFIPGILAQNVINHVLDKLPAKAVIRYILVPSDRFPHGMSLVAESDFPQPPLEAHKTYCNHLFTYLIVTPKSFPLNGYSKITDHSVMSVVLLVRVSLAITIRNVDIVGNLCLSSTE